MFMIIYLSLFLLFGCFINSSDTGKENAPNTDSLVINEIVARPVGAETDWIELYAAGDGEIDLSQYSVRDDNPDHQRAPLGELSLKPGEYLIIACTDSVALVQGPSAPFKLGGSDGVKLYRGNAVVDEISWTSGDAPRGKSFGHLPDASGPLAMLDPTPGRPNLPASDTVKNTDTLLQYGGESKVLFPESEVNTFELSFYRADWSAMLSSNYLNGQVYMPAKLKYKDIVMDSIGVRYKGNSSYMRSRSTPKKPLKFRFDKFKNQTFYGQSYLNFSNCVSDPSFMREKLGYDIVRQYLPAPRTAFANIRIEGKLIGLYVQIEQIDEVFLNRFFSDARGSLFKVGDDGGALEALDSLAEYQKHYELKNKGGTGDWSRFERLLALLNKAPADSFILQLKPLLNLDNIIRHLAFNMTLSHFDSYNGSGRNFYLYDDPESGLFHILHWDLNECFGAFANSWDVKTVDIHNPPNLDQRPLLKRIVENDSLKKVYAGYIREFAEGPASATTVAAAADKLKPLIDAHVKADSNKLYSYDEFMANIENAVITGGQTRMTIPGIKSFAEERNKNIIQQLAQ